MEQQANSLGSVTCHLCPRSYPIELWNREGCHQTRGCNGRVGFTGYGSCWYPSPFDSNYFLIMDPATLTRLHQNSPVCDSCIRRMLGEHTLFIIGDSGANGIFDTPDWWEDGKEHHQQSSSHSNEEEESEENKQWKRRVASLVKAGYIKKWLEGNPSLRGRFPEGIHIGVSGNNLEYRSFLLLIEATDRRPDQEMRQELSNLLPQEYRAIPIRIARIPQ